MKCSQCGAEVDSGLKFCKKCGARVKAEEIKSSDQTQRNINIAQEGIQLLMKPTQAQARAEYEKQNQEIQFLRRSTTSVEKKIEPAQVQPQVEEEMAATSNLSKAKIQGGELDLGVQNQATNKAKYTLNVDVGELKLFFKTIKELIKNPLMNQKAINEKVETKNTYIYMFVLLALNTFMSVVLMEFILRGLRDLIDVVAYLMSNLNADMSYLTGRIGLSFVIGNLVIHIGHIVIFTLLMYFVYSKVVKQEINWKELGKYFLAPLGVLAIGKLPVLFIMIINVKLGLVLYLILVCMMILLSIIGFNKGYGKDGVSLYSLMGLYLLSFSINVFVGIKIIMLF